MQCGWHEGGRAVASVGPEETEPQQRVLIVEDDLLVRRVLQDHLSRLYAVSILGSAEAHPDRLEDLCPDVLLVDIRRPPSTGLDFLSTVRERLPSCVVLAMSASPTVDAVVEAMRRGARDLFAKPVDMADLLARIRAELGDPTEPRDHDAPQEAGLDDAPEGLCGRTSSLRDVLRIARTVAPTMATVLIIGETGTGKEVIARFIHECSGRSGPFVAVNCGAIPSELMESEFFGHEAGAFTGARERKKGRFEHAHRGTILLDEIGDLPLALQVKLLRVLQERRVERVGGTAAVDVDVRVVAATHHDLRADVEAGRFRVDLFYRLDVISVRVPPLRDRREDIGPLWAKFVAQFAQREQRSVPGTRADVTRRLLEHAWPGNVRELENVAERAVILAQGQTIQPRHLPPALRRGVSPDGAAPSPLPIPGASLEQIEKLAILQTLRAVNGSTSKAAQILGISTRKIQYRLKAWKQQVELTALPVT